MLRPEEDLADRRPIWDVLQMFWMDTDPGLFLEDAARICAGSKYSLEEVEGIFWNEVRPAVEFNMMFVAGEWTGFELEWLSARILQRHRFGEAVPRPESDRYVGEWWIRLRERILALRNRGSCDT